MSSVRTTLAAAILSTAPLAANANDPRDKIGSALEYMHGIATGATSPSPEAAQIQIAPMSADGYVTIDAVASNDTQDLVDLVVSLGGRNVASYHRTVSAQFPAARLGELAASNHLAFATPVLAATNVGLVTSQGDRSMRTDVLRNEFGLDGEGVTVGILSDSFSCDERATPLGPVFTTTEQDQATGDLPPPEHITILDDLLDESLSVDDCLDLGAIDEGRAMGQLIYDSAPGVKLAYHTAFRGQADFASGIIELAEAGADVIVDDIIYFAEPMFQDGIIAQAADEVARLGIPYYSSNGNRGRDAFQSDYRAVDGTAGDTDGIWHDFDPGAGVDLLKTVTLGAFQTNLSFQWDNPNFSVSGPPGAQSDVDVVMFDINGNRVPDCFLEGVSPLGLCQFQFTAENGPVDGGDGGDAIELVSLVDFAGGSTVQIGLLTETGEAPGFFKYVIFAGGFVASEYPIDAPSGYGHNNAAGAEGVGASAFANTEEFIGDPQTFDIREFFGRPPCVPACLNDFSSAVGTPIIFDTEGNRLPQPEVRLKPGITGPDGTNTTFFGVDSFYDDDDGDGIGSQIPQGLEPGEFPNFFGTSAAAPHVAAVAALLIDAEGSEIVRSNGRFNMCRPDDDDDDDSSDAEGPREDGDNRRVRADRVASRIERGWLLGPCKRTEPQEIYAVKRATAQDMTTRISINSPAPDVVFEEVGPAGFDFDSGFGFIDADAALAAFLGVDDDDDSDDEDSDSDD